MLHVAMLLVKLGVAATGCSTGEGQPGLFLVQDVVSLNTANPATHPQAVRIPQPHGITQRQVRIP